MPGRQSEMRRKPNTKRNSRTIDETEAASTTADLAGPWKMVVNCENYQGKEKGVCCLIQQHDYQLTY